MKNIYSLIIALLMIVTLNISRVSADTETPTPTETPTVTVTPSPTPESLFPTADATENYSDCPVATLDPSRYVDPMYFMQCYQCQPTQESTTTVTPTISVTPTITETLNLTETQTPVPSETTTPQLTVSPTWDGTYYRYWVKYQDYYEPTTIYMASYSGYANDTYWAHYPDIDGVVNQATNGDTEALVLSLQFTDTGCNGERKPWWLYGTGAIVPAISSSVALSNCHTMGLYHNTYATSYVDYQSMLGLTNEVSYQVNYNGIRDAEISMFFEQDVWLYIRSMNPLEEEPEPTATPTITPTLSTGYCNNWDYLDTGAQNQIASISNIQVYAPEEIILLRGDYIDLSWIGSERLSEPIGWPTIALSVIKVDLGDIYVLGFRLPIEMIVLPFVMFAISLLMRL